MFKNSEFCPHTIAVRVSYRTIRRNSDYLPNIIHRQTFRTEKEFVTNTKRLNFKYCLHEFKA
jgi:hypothetical protein